ncbi:hypothetical protein [Pedobacter africanus]|uniref:Uncharacterized protein n=1 Tax=Pedobacter africanus TaxID=151894 RepID=A0A1W1ZBR2_9SPHI|nr:hypothetical protein [Pedobacter africanus]SMC45702.1 hypothetical protein SAMN04488524_0560 [Pedobacter africanus]
MAWEIERIGVRASGAFSKWAYKRVVIDENGEVYAEGIPGQRDFNLSINDYKYTDRRFRPGDLVTEFCNFNTHTFFRVYAQNENPFVYVETDINQPKCGYQEPLPEPAVPVNPFGNPVYGPYRTFDYCDIEGQLVEVVIEAKNYDGDVFPIEIGGKSPVVLSYKEVDNKFDPIRPVEAELSFIETNNFVLDEFFNGDERAFRVTALKNSKIQFRGYIIPDSCAAPFNAPPYPVSIRATDALGGLKSVTYPVPVGSLSEIRQSFVDILAYCFAMTNLNLNIVTICNVYDPLMPTGLNDDPLSLATVNPLRLSKDNGTTMTVYEVLEQVAIAWGAFIVQVNGEWNFVRIDELSKASIRRRTYNYKGLFLYADNLDNNRIAGAAV